MPTFLNGGNMISKLPMGFQSGLTTCFRRSGTKGLIIYTKYPYTKK